MDLIALVERANKAVLDIYNNADSYQVQIKADHSPLTAADLAAHQVLTAGVCNLDCDFPHQQSADVARDVAADAARDLAADAARDVAADAASDLKLELPQSTLIVSEEGGSQAVLQRVQAERFWLIDPVDGTTEFISGSGEFTTNIALIENHQVTLGLVGLPIANEIYVAEKNAGSYKVVRRAEGWHFTKLAVRQQVDHSAAQALIMLQSRSHLSERDAALRTSIQQALQRQGIHNSIEAIATGSSLKIIKIATGSADFYPRLGPTSEWDIAAADIILQEAGGQVMNLSKQEALCYGTVDSIINPSFCALPLPITPMRQIILDVLNGV